jgi:hypothetical protein
VFRSNKPTITDFPAGYATHADLCDVFRNDTRRLYLLAFLLRANHGKSEQCFVSMIEEIFKEPPVFRVCARSWVKRKLIENAIEIVSPASARNGHKARSLERKATRDTKRMRNRHRDQNGRLRALRFCQVVPGVLSHLGLRSVAGMRHEQSTSGADEGVVPTRRACP